MKPKGLKIRRSDRIELRFLEAVSRRLPDSTHVLEPLGDLYTKVGLYELGLQVDEKLVALCPDGPGIWYNLACSLARVGRKDDALDALQKAVELGYRDADWMRVDEDLHSLCGDHRFQRILQQLYAMG
jgi:Flp pilus assembly protein TadD